MIEDVNIILQSSSFPSNLDNNVLANSYARETKATMNMDRPRVEIYKGIKHKTDFHEILCKSRSSISNVISLRSNSVRIVRVSPIGYLTVYDAVERNIESI